MDATLPVLERKRVESPSVTVETRTDAIGEVATHPDKQARVDGGDGSVRGNAEQPILSIIKFGDSASIRVRESDGYFCATDMCKTYNKRWRDYSRLKDAAEYLSEVSAETGIAVEQLEDHTKFPDGRDGPTYVSIPHDPPFTTNANHIFLIAR